MADKEIGTRSETLGPYLHFFALFVLVTVAVEMPSASGIQAQEDENSITEIWNCFAMSDRQQKTALFTLSRTIAGDRGQKLGSVSFAGTTQAALFQVAGLNRRWDFGYDGNTDKFQYAFIIGPEGIGRYYDFTMASGVGVAVSSATYRCAPLP